MAQVEVKLKLKLRAPRWKSGRDVYHGAVPVAPEAQKLNQSVQKAISLLRAVAQEGGVSVSALSRSVGLPRATALRMIQTLEREGFLLRVPDADRMLLGPELLRIARKADVGMMLREVARGPLAELRETVRETVTLSVVAPAAASISSTRSMVHIISCRGCGSDSDFRCMPARAARCYLPPTTRSASAVPPPAAGAPDAGHDHEGAPAAA